LSAHRRLDYTAPILSSPSRLAVAVLLLLGVHGASAVSAQTSSGALYGVVTDERGCPLPGATVTVRGEQGVARVQVANARGEFRFLALEPALYHGQIELQGFSTAEYPDIPVHLGRSTTIDVALAASDTGAVTVTAECPLLDERRISTGVNVTREELEKIPTARDPWSILQQAPGVLLDRIDVGGSESGHPAVARAPGIGIDQNVYVLDGVPITDPEALDATPTVYDFASFDEVQVTTGGTDAAVATGGVVLNLVTKRGTNVWRASARYLIADEAWQSGPHDLDLANGQRSFTSSPSLDRVREYGAEGGGAIRRDRVWIWGGHHRTSTDLTLDPPPTLFEQGAGDRAAASSALKLDAALGRSNHLQAFAYSNDAEIDALGGGPTRSLDATLDLDAPTDVYKLEDSHAVGPSLYLYGHLSRVDGRYDTTPHGGAATPVLDAAGVFRDGFLATESDRERDQAKLEVSGFFGDADESHELRLGIGRRGAESKTLGRWGAQDAVFLEDGTIVNAPTLVLFQPAASETELDVTSVYAQDTFRIGELTGDVGLRYDDQQSERSEAALPAHPLRPDLLPATLVPGAAAARWESLAPRVGLTYAIGEEHATLLRASWSRFADQLGTALAADAISGPELSPFPFAAVRFFDADGDRQADPEEVQVTIPGRLGGAVIDPALEAPLTDEILLGAEHAGVGCFSIGGRLTWRRARGLVDQLPFVREDAGTVRVATRDDYLPDTFASGTLPDRSPYSVPVYALRPGLELIGSRFLTNGDRETEYLGATVWLERRLRNRWQFRGYANVRDEAWTAPPELLPFDDPTDLLGFDDNDGAPFGPRSVFDDKSDVFLHSRWDYSLAGLYRARAGIAVAILAHGREGYPLLYFESVPGSDGLTRSVAVTDEDSPLRLDNVHLLDVRVEKAVRLGDSALTLSLDAFNLLNSTIALQRGSELEAPAADFVREIVSPRIVRLGLRIEFQ
jgi:Carboxypeptidase regulatory-like domain/TonB-dependent Receptor Plug Domain